MEQTTMMNADIQKILLMSMTKIVSRFEKNEGAYPYIDTKFDIVTGRDFGAEDEPFRRKECIYSWIQGRSLESLAKHVLYFRSNGENALADRLSVMLAQVAEAMEKLRFRNNGRLPFAMRPDGTSFFPAESSHANYSDLFYGKGLFAAARVLSRPEWENEAEKLFTFVLDEIDANEFHTDQQCFDPKNKVTFIPGKFPQGSRMIALGGIADWCEAKPEAPQWADRAEKFIRFIMEHHVNRGQYAACQRWDFIESIDAQQQPWRDGETLFCDPGHALEFVGLAGKCLLVLRQQGRKAELIQDAGKILPEVFRHVFDYGFNPAAGGLCKGFDLAGRRVLNSDMPWWNLPETVRAGFEMADLYPGERSAKILFRAGRAFQAFTQGFLQSNGFGCQTRSAEGKIINVIPAVSDADPGYHTNLSLIDALALMENESSSHLTKGGKK